MVKNSKDNLYKAFSKALIKAHKKWLIYVLKSGKYNILVMLTAKRELAKLDKRYKKILK